MDLTEQILQATGASRRHIALTIRAQYQPAGGDGRTVMPPTYPTSDRDPNRAYLIGERLVDRERRPAVVLDQEPSQANRVEQALLIARDEGRLTLPIFEMTVETRYGKIRLTSLDFPHRYADAYLRDSLIGGVPFDASQAGQRLREATAGDVRPLYEREPLSLVLGAWDSHRKGRWPRFPRLYSSSMFGLDPVTWLRRGGRMCPVNLTGSVDDTGAAKDGKPWKWEAARDKGRKHAGSKLSEIGHGNIAPNPVHGGVTISGIDRTATISLSGLDRLRFGDGTPRKPPSSPGRRSPRWPSPGTGWHSVGHLCGCARAATWARQRRSSAWNCPAVRSRSCPSPPRRPWTPTTSCASEQLPRA
jgi:CRISPR-associated protein Csb1